MGWARSVAHFGEVPDDNKQWFVFPEIFPATNPVHERLHNALIRFKKAHMARMYHQSVRPGAVNWRFSAAVQAPPPPPPPGHPGTHGTQ